MGTIRLGLERIALLMKDVPLSWRAIHVAGTNGKGSICSHLTAMLRRSGIRCGQFTSPHLVHRWDGISIEGDVVNENIFRATEAEVRRRNDANSADASDFEILTATAFEIFNQEKVQIGVIECGMGGLTDATNIIEDPVVTVISNISLDHQSFLGNTVEEISEQKAGIIKAGRPCIVNGSNQKSVLDVIKGIAHTKQSPLVVTPDVAVDAQSDRDHSDLDDLFASLGFNPKTLEVTQQRNIVSAYCAMRQALPTLEKLPNFRFGSNMTEIAFRRDIAAAMQGATITGRYQWLSLEALTGRTEPVLMDGAHNRDAWEALARFRSNQAAMETGVTWVMAVSNGRSISEIAGHLIRPQDQIVFTEFDAVDGMPWVRPVEAGVLAEQTRLPAMCHVVHAEPDVAKALQRATVLAKKGPIIIAGSLYLVSTVTRLLRGA